MKTKKPSRSATISQQASQVTRHDETWEVLRRRQLALFEKEQTEQRISELSMQLNVARRRVADLQAMVEGYDITINKR